MTAAQARSRQRSRRDTLLTGWGVLGRGWRRVRRRGKLLRQAVKVARRRVRGYSKLRVGRGIEVCLGHVDVSSHIFKHRGRRVVGARCLEVGVAAIRWGGLRDGGRRVRPERIPPCDEVSLLNGEDGDEWHVHGGRISVNDE